MILTGCEIVEKFKSEFLACVEYNVRYSENVTYELNIQNGVNIHMICYCAYASDYFNFIDALETELKNNNIAIIDTITASENSDDYDEFLTIVVND